MVSSRSQRETVTEKKVLAPEEEHPRLTLASTGTQSLMHVTIPKYLPVGQGVEVEGSDVEI